LLQIRRTDSVVFDRFTIKVLDRYQPDILPWTGRVKHVFRKNCLALNVSDPKAYKILSNTYGCGMRWLLMEIDPAYSLRVCKT
jgi:hypothetical protein